MKQRTGTLIFVLAFMLLWACTPSSLFKGGSQKETTGTVLPPDNPTQSTPDDSLKTPTKDMPADTVAKDTIPVEVISTDSIPAAITLYI